MNCSTWVSLSPAFRRSRTSRRRSRASGALESSIDWFWQTRQRSSADSALARALGRRIVSALTANPKFVSALTRQGMQIIATSPTEALAAMHADSKKWGDVIKATGTTINQ